MNNVDGANYSFVNDLNDFFFIMFYEIDYC